MNPNIPVAPLGSVIGGLGHAVEFMPAYAAQGEVRPAILFIQIPSMWWNPLTQMITKARQKPAGSEPMFYGKPRPL